VTITTVFSIYPNPTSDHVSIICTENSGTDSYIIVLYDALGQELRQILFLSSNQLTVDLSGYSSGVYMLKIVSDAGFFVEKVIKR
jgi:hypothetical protein